MMGKLNWRDGAIFGALVALVPAVAFAQDVTPTATAVSGSIPNPENPPLPVSSSVIDGVLSMSNTSLYLFVIAGVLSFACAIVFRQSWPADLKTALFALSCLVAGAIYTYVDQDHWVTSDWIRRFITMAVVGTLFYKTFQSGLQRFSIRTDTTLKRDVNDQPI